MSKLTGTYFTITLVLSESSPTILLPVDANKAREKLPRGSSAEKWGENVGKEAGSNIDEAVWLH